MTFRYFFIIILLASISACSVTQSIEEGQHIVAKNSIKISGDEDISKVELEPYITQPQTPKALAFFYTNLWIYKTFKEKKDNGFNRWIIRVFGDEPIIWDPAETIKSEKDITAYLNNIGYFNAKVSSFIFQNKKKASITYKIEPEIPYRVEEIKWDIADEKMRNEAIESNSLIEIGDIFNTYKLDDERSRISELLRNQGYFEFNHEYVNFLVDSSLSNHTVHITAQVQSKWQNNESKLEKGFEKYTIGKVYVFTDYENDQKNSKPYDTLIIDLNNIRNAKAIGEYHFLYKDKLKVKPSVIAQSIFIEPEELFNSRDLKETYRKINRFPIFKYVEVGFRKNEDTTKSILDTHIKLHRSRLQYYSIETDGTNSSGDLGIRLGFNYGNKNLFRGGEWINLRLTAAVENRKYSGYEEANTNSLFNTMEYGIIVSLNSPTFIVPIKQNRFPKYFTPQTFIRFGFNYQLRPSYKRYISSFQFGYEWRQSKSVFHRLSPLDISITKIFPSPTFQQGLDTITNLRYKNQYQDHFIAAIKYDYIYNSQRLGEVGNFTYFNARFEAAGNLTYTINELTKAQKTEGQYTINGIPYAQFFRMDLDYRYYIALTNNQGIIYRINLGIGAPYGNSISLPFEKGFYSGGANGMRAWAYRDLGPGNYNNSLGPDYDKMGDIKLEANLEYRFPLYGYLKGAAFIDAGNIWLIHSSTTFPGGEFGWNTFYKQFAFDGGIGFRFDFDFFIIRVDGAVKIQDPSLSKHNRFVLPKTQIKDIFWSFGIGYPF